MKKKFLSQEMLKLIACVTMLIDHLGVVFFPNVAFRVIGRLAFPLYCFLLTEGIAHTRNPRRYCFRMALVALLAELPYDFLFYGGWTWQHQNVMITLLLGAGMLLLGKRPITFLAGFAVCFLLAGKLRGDYGGWGIALIAVFAVSRRMPGSNWLRLGGMAWVFLAMNSFKVNLGLIQVPVQVFGLLALIPICLYSGQKATFSRTVQRIFYLFYPVHLTVLLIIKQLAG